MKRSEILEQAKEIISGKREDTYGGPEDSFHAVAQLWNAFLINTSNKHGEEYNITLEATDVALMMMLLKAARLTTAPDHLDSWVDAAGYAACGGEIGTDHD